MDYDIPIVSGTPMPPPMAPNNSAYDTTTYNAMGQAQTTSRPNLHTATATNGGRSSRVVLPTAGQENIRISSQTIRDLRDQGFTQGLAESLQTNKRAFPLSIWIIDNSGSMNQRDGHRFVETTNSSVVKVVECTRWAEMQQTVSYHVQLAALLQSPTVFRMLNDPGRVAGPQQFSIAETTTSSSPGGGSDAMTRISEQVAVAQQVMLNTTPGGVTPLIPHLQEVRQNILDMEDQLRAEGAKVVLVLATDGLPTDERGISDRATQQQFVSALRSLEGLPVWIVVRLCTDEVLDDFIAEAKEIQETNAWLNYGLPLHRMREMGFYSKLFDMLDERKLAKDELRDFFRLLFGTNHMDGVPDPEADWSGFVDSIERLCRKEGKTWNPITKRMDYWVDIRKLKRAYKKKGWFW
eukprot:scaffold2330_cov153-Amphora_coffeaeformis.AAC.2